MQLMEILRVQLISTQNLSSNEICVAGGGKMIIIISNSCALSSSVGQYS